MHEIAEDTKSPRVISTRQVVIHGNETEFLPESSAYGRKFSPAFTLLELVVVIAIIALVSTLAASAFSYLSSGGKFDQALVRVAGSLESARDYAVSNGAYSYVGLTDVGADGRMALATFGAADASSGIESLTKEGHYDLAAAPPSTGGLSLLDRIVQIEGCAAQDTIPEGSALQSLPVLTGTTSPLRFPGPTFTYADGSRGVLRFTRVIQFTPEGAARAIPAIVDSLQLVLVPTKGDASKPHRDVANAAAIRIAGLTGQVKIYRP